MLTLLTLVFGGALIGAAAALVSAFAFPRHRRKSFFAAAGSFAVCAVLGGSIWMLFLPAVIACLLAGAFSRHSAIEKDRA